LWGFARHFRQVRFGEPGAPVLFLFGFGRTLTY
jgi:hypothetical protein